MLVTVVCSLVSLFVGWNIPQPEYAKKIQAKIVAWWKETFQN